MELGPPTGVGLVVGRRWPHRAKGEREVPRRRAEDSPPYLPRTATGPPVAAAGLAGRMSRVTWRVLPFPTRGAPGRRAVRG